MCYKVSYFVKTHNIHVALVANKGQIKVHLVPKIGKYTRENKGIKHTSRYEGWRTRNK
jgi:hypothetical protein